LLGGQTSWKALLVQDMPFGSAVAFFSSGFPSFEAVWYYTFFQAAWCYNTPSGLLKKVVLIRFGFNIVNVNDE
jgi:hypothetical protein